MIVDRLKRVVRQNQELKGGFFLRTLLKEALQDYVLNFVYNHREYKKLLFTGGTCLRKLYGLPRLSEDLDFDFENAFSIQDFEREIRIYFQQELQYRDLETRISGNEQTLFLKFSLLDQIGLVNNKADSTVLFLRCDFSRESYGIFGSEINSLSTDDFSFYVLSYDLPTLFANKIIAFLTREYFRGSEQSFSFKGRDVYDLVWFLERTRRSDLQPNWKRIYKALDLKTADQVANRVIDRIDQINASQVREDLLPFIGNLQSIDGFASHFPDLVKQGMKGLIEQK